MKISYKDTVLADSERTVEVEKNDYYPREDVNMDHFVKSDTQYTCPWKGAATYYSVKYGDKIIKDAAWSYEEPKEKAKHIAGHVAFDKKLVD